MARKSWVWEGYIEQIYEDTFVTRLSRNGSDECFVEIYKREVREEDQDHIIPGALLTWHITAKSSAIRFYKHRWQLSEILRAQHKARKWSSIFP